jgi:hypothetical protein
MPFFPELKYIWKARRQAVSSVLPRMFQASVDSMTFVAAKCSLRIGSIGAARCDSCPITTRILIVFAILTTITPV